MGQKFLNLNLAALQHIDNGVLAVAFQRAVEECLRDIEDRPTNKTARTITMVFKMLPVTDIDPMDEKRLIAKGLTTDVTVKSSVPDRTSKTYSFGLTESKDAQGNPKPSAYMSINSPTNFEQLVFADTAEDDPE